MKNIGFIIHPASGREKDFLRFFSRFFTKKAPLFLVKPTVAFSLLVGYTIKYLSIFGFDQHRTILPPQDVLFLYTASRTGEHWFTCPAFVVQFL
ncbi:MAG: hypothetical protein J5482_04405 [Oscillospiraceae bacterium]|nr:hypothetical protein [Oscillospiraceae bacterium]